MPDKATAIRLFGTAQDSIVDGPGLRFAVFVQGCDHRCPGCHNPESQIHEGGFLLSIDELVQQIEANKLVSGVTLSGGDPFCQCAACLELARRLKQKKMNIWIYSGYTFEQLIEGTPDPLAAELLQQCDVLVDGPFIQDLHLYTLKWRGSSNQRIIDIPASFEKGEVVLWEAEDTFPDIAPSW